MQGRSSSEQLLNPPPDSALARARDFGIDLTLIAGRLKLTPEARLDDLQRFMNDLEAARSGARMVSTHDSVANIDD